MEIVELCDFFFFNLQIKMMPIEVAMKQQGLIQGIFSTVKAAGSLPGGVGSDAEYR